MFHDLSGRRTVLFKQILDQSNSASRTIEFVSQQHIGGTGRGAKTTMNAFAQDLVGDGNVGIGKLRRCELRSHLAHRFLNPSHHAVLVMLFWPARSAPD
jgi:hypothetical protein